MKVISLISSNIKRLRAVEIHPQGKSLIVTGQNEQGKSSILDSILFALGGKDGVCDQPVRTGEDKGSVTVELGGNPATYIVTRTFTASGGGTLKVVPKDGTNADKLQSPQAFLDSIIGPLSFDPIAFSRMKPREQAEKLRELVGLDFTQMDKDRQKLYDERHSIGQVAEILRGKLHGRTRHVDVPAEPVDVSATLAEKNKIEAQNKANAARRQKFLTLLNERSRLEREIENTEAQLQRAKDSLQNVNSKLSENDTNPTPADGSTAELDAQITTASAVNKKVAENAELDAQINEHTNLTKQYDGKTAAIADLDAERQQKLAQTKFPLEGLSFSPEGDVIFNGLPFSQASSAQQLKVSVAIGMAMNPKVRVMLVRDASLLDSKSMEVLKELAEKYDTQIWVETVGDTLEGQKLCGVVIEDGGVVESNL